jgi:hypothetical protein
MTLALCECWAVTRQGPALKAGCSLLSGPAPVRV